MKIILTSVLVFAALVFINFYGNTSENNTQLNNRIMENNIKEVKNKVVKAPELRVDKWIGADGKELKEPIRLADSKGKYRIIYCFQHWCPGCHSLGLPSLKKLVDEFGDNEKIEFMAVQTVFEGSHANTYDKIAENQKKYDLDIPFGHDPGEGRSTIMQDYNTGGTPWFIFINEKDEIEFADFHINVDGTIKYLNEILK